ncbi:hypothetical protein BGZ60DRAFT_424927 [Tricladium varicosporioides]|nr:hypothetical protein BGZ60DRAFT_424927 [Hymenoscyphus varicosporioides]
MSSSFLAPVFSQPVDPNLLSKSAQEFSLRPVSSPWQYAVERFNSTLSINSPKAIPFTSSGGLEEFIASAMQAQLTAQKTRSKALDKINAIIDRISYYKGPIDTLSQTSQEAMFAWGSLKFLMELVGSEKKVSNRLAEAIADVVDIFGRCEIYARLFASNKRVIEGIGTLYGDVLSLLVGATRFYGKSGVSKSCASPKFWPYVRLPPHPISYSYAFLYG